MALNAKIHLIFILFNAYCGFRPTVQFVTKDWQALASAAIVKEKDIRSANLPTLIIL